jgi:hypothetical protein
MRSSELDFRAFQWRGNRFTVERREGSLVLVVHDLQLQDEAPRLVRLGFAEASHEWAMLWDGEANQWKPHPEPVAPLGNAIVEAFVKPSGIGLLFSFAGNHPLGWSRWGFTARSVEEC